MDYIKSSFLSTNSRITSVHRATPTLICTMFFPDWLGLCYLKLTHGVIIWVPRGVSNGPRDAKNPVFAESRRSFFLQPHAAISFRQRLFSFCLLQSGGNVLYSSRFEIVNGLVYLFMSLWPYYGLQWLTMAYNGLLVSLDISSSFMFF